MKSFYTKILIFLDNFNIFHPIFEKILNFQYIAQNEFRTAWFKNKTEMHVVELSLFTYDLAGTIGREKRRILRYKSFTL